MYTNTRTHTASHFTHHAKNAIKQKQSKTKRNKHNCNIENIGDRHNHNHDQDIKHTTEMTYIIAHKRQTQIKIQTNKHELAHQLTVKHQNMLKTIKFTMCISYDK